MFESGSVRVCVFVCYPYRSICESGEVCVGKFVCLFMYLGVPVSVHVCIRAS